MVKPKILLIEDDVVLSKVIKEELEENGFEVFQAIDGEIGLTMASEKIPDLILLDILLPKKNGFEVLEALKKSPETKAVPVTLLTMLGSDDDIKKGLQLGSNDYIVKSQHSLPEIIEKIKIYFSKEKNLQLNQSNVERVETDQINKI